jgi:flagellar protein FliL
MADNAEDQEGAAPEPAPKPLKSKKGGAMKWLVIGSLFIVLGGAGAAWWMLGASTTEAAEASEPELSTRGVFAFEPFLVNLADEGGQRFLKATVSLVVESPEEAKHIEEMPVIVAHVRSAIIEVLTQQKAPALVTPDGKTALKQAIKERTSPLMPNKKVLDVLFSEFVVQF